MKQRTAVILLVAAFLLAGGVWAFITFWPGMQQQQAGGVPPLPPGTRSFGSWALVCGQDPQNPNRCGLLIRAIDQQSQQLVVSLNLTRGPQGNPIIVVNTPPGIVIPSGVTLTPANGTAARGAVQVCRPRGCTGIVVLSDTLLTELAAAQATTVSFVSANGQTANLNLPTTGFAEGFTAWRAAFPPPAQPEAAAPPAEEVPAEVPEEAPPGYGRPRAPPLM